MNSPIIQITTAFTQSENGHYLYALCADGSIWYCQPQNASETGIVTWSRLNTEHK